jgi:UDP-glucose 4-epimerase
MSDYEVNIFNIGSEDATNPTRIAEIIVEEMGLYDVNFSYTGGSRGWKGDVPKMMLGIDKLKGMGWKNEWESERSVRETVKSLLGK